MYVLSRHVYCGVKYAIHRRRSLLVGDGYLHQGKVAGMGARTSWLVDLAAVHRAVERMIEDRHGLDKHVD